MIMVISIAPVLRDYVRIFFIINHHVYLGLPNLFAKKVRCFSLLFYTRYIKAFLSVFFFFAFIMY